MSKRIESFLERLCEWTFFAYCFVVLLRREWLVEYGGPLDIAVMVP